MKVQSQFIEMFGTIDEPKVEVKKLIDVVLSSGQYGSNTSATDYQEGKPRYIRITDINDDGSLNDDIKTAEVIEDKYKLIPGDIVFARTGATVGKTYMHETGNAIYAGYLIKYQMDESKMKPAFMKAYTHSKTYYNWVANTQKVGAQPNISAAQYDNMPVLVPQIEKQEEFLTIYNQADKSEFDSLRSEYELKLSFPEGDNIPQVWVSMIAGGDQNLAKQYLNDYVHKLGNLTITGYNSTLSNNSFENKRNRQDKKTHRYIGYRNGLDINKEIAQKETWTIDDITNRTDELVKELLKMYKFPE